MTYLRVGNVMIHFHLTMLSAKTSHPEALATTSQEALGFTSCCTVA